MEIHKYLTIINRTVPAYERKIEWLTIHYTANNGDTAKNNCNYFYKEFRDASAHYFVDENEIWQCVEDENISWHCGTKGTYYNDCRNMNSIGIELCSRKDEKGNYYFKPETIKNAVWLVQYLMGKYNIKIDKVCRHYDVTRKQCPAPFVKDKTAWENFLKEVKGEDTMERYNNIEDVPEYGRGTVEKLLINGYLKGDGKGLDLSKDMVRMLVILDRSGIFDREG